jgi:hypothetical protein
VAPGAGRGGELALDGDRELWFGDMEGSGDGWWGQQHSHVNVFNALKMGHFTICAFYQFF